MPPAATHGSGRCRPSPTPPVAGTPPPGLSPPIFPILSCSSGSPLVLTLIRHRPVLLGLLRWLSINAAPAGSRHDHGLSSSLLLEPLLHGVFCLRLLPLPHLCQLGSLSLCSVTSFCASSPNLDFDGMVHRRNPASIWCCCCSWFFSGGAVMLHLIGLRFRRWRDGSTTTATPASPPSSTILTSPPPSSASAKIQQGKFFFCDRPSSR